MEGGGGGGRQCVCVCRWVYNSVRLYIQKNEYISIK